MVIRFASTLSTLFACFIGLSSPLASPPLPAPRPPASRPASAQKPPASRPASAQKPPASRPASASRPWKKAICPEGRRYGMYCLGQIVGKIVRTEMVTCPIAKERFEVLVVTGMQAEGLDSDLRPHLGRFRQKEYIWMCPSVSYAAFAEDFHETFDLKKMERTLVTFRRAYPSYEEIPASARFEAAALSYFAKGRGAAFFATFFLRAAWATREEKEFRAETRFRRRAISAFLLALKQGLFPDSKQPSAMYLVAELLRQDGRFTPSKEWFERALLRTHDLSRTTGRFGRGLEEMILAGKAKADQKDREVYVLPWSKRLQRPTPSVPPKKIRLPWQAPSTPRSR